MYEKDIWCFLADETSFSDNSFRRVFPGILMNFDEYFILEYIVPGKKSSTAWKEILLDHISEAKVKNFAG